MIESSFSWLVAVAAVVGVWFNIRLHVVAFWIWACTNAAWVYADLTHGLLPQAALQAVYFLLSLYGIYCWRGRRNERGSRGGE